MRADRGVINFRHQPLSSTLPIAPSMNALTLETTRTTSGPSFALLDGSDVAPSATRVLSANEATIETVAVKPAQVSIRELTDADCARWDAFVMATPDATFFHRSAWRDVIEDVFGHRTIFLYAERAGRIVGVLPLARQKSVLFGDALISLPFCVYGGVVAEDRVAADALLDAAEARASDLGVGHLECRGMQRHRDAWTTTDLYVTFRKEIVADEETNMLAIPRKQRAMVRKGIKAGLVSVVDDDIDRFFALYADNVHRHGTPAQSRRYFETLQKTFGKDCQVLTVVTPEGKIASSVLSFTFRNEVLPYYAGDSLISRETAANDFKYWELMRRSAEAGYTLFDYGRSKVGTGPYDFKRNWGFTPQPLAYEYKLIRAPKVPENNPLNPKYRAFIALWQRMPLSLANRLGPFIARSLG
jgi:FemAB-related protein (PEP-CTERM system-associated)